MMILTMTRNLGILGDVWIFHVLPFLEVHVDRSCLNTVIFTHIYMVRLYDDVDDDDGNTL